MLRVADPIRSSLPVEHSGRVVPVEGPRPELVVQPELQVLQGPPGPPALPVRREPLALPGVLPGPLRGRQALQARRRPRRPYKLDVAT